jgi:hypothetical protein
MKLYEISNLIRDLSLFDDNTQSEFALQELEMDFSTKALNIAKLIKELNADIEAIDNETKRLNDRKKSLQGKIDWFKTYLLTNMETSNIPQIKDSIITISVRNNPPSCEINDLTELDTKYIIIKQEPDKKAILEYFKSTGEVIPGTKIITDKKRIDIR